MFMTFFKTLVLIVLLIANNLLYLCWMRTCFPGRLHITSKYLSNIEEVIYYSVDIILIVCVL